MRLHIGAVPEDTSFHPEEEGWLAANKLGPVKMQLLGLPVLVAIFLVVGGILRIISPRWFYPANLWIGLLILVFTVPIHEMIHALFTPQMGMSDNTLLGIWPAKLLVYAYYSAPISRNRFVLIGVAPFCVLTVLPIIVVAFLRTLSTSESLLSTIGYLALLNGALSYGDITNVLFVRQQIPSSAVTRFNGWRVYWKNV